MEEDIDIRLPRKIVWKYWKISLLARQDVGTRGFFVKQYTKGDIALLHLDEWKNLFDLDERPLD